MITKLSHHNMSTYFSSTDNAELYDNSEVYNYYLSLIVNNRYEMVARVAYREFEEIEGVSNITRRDKYGNFIKVKKEKTKQVTYKVKYIDCKIIKEKFEVDDNFVKRYEKLKAEKNKIVYNTTPAFYGNSPGSYNHLVKSNNLVTNQAAINFNNRISQESSIKTGISREEVINFLVAWLNMDVLSFKPLNSSLAELDRDLKKETEVGSDALLDMLEETIDDFYSKMFPEDVDFIMFDTVIDKALEIISMYYNIYKDAVTNLQLILNHAKQEEKEELL